jgi:putative ABC transport system permease protein
MASQNQIFPMLKNYFKIALRNITRQKAHATINISGLALGMTCCLLIFLWVQDEKSIDNFHLNGKHLFTVYQNSSFNGKPVNNYNTPVEYPSNGHPIFLFEEMKQSIPEIKDETFYATGYDLPWGHPETFQVGEKILKLEGSRAGPDFFQMFSYPLVEGNAHTALKEMGGIAISRKMANLFFGSPRNAMGKSMRYENRLNFVVTAVFEDLSRQSSLQFDFLLNWDAQKNELEWASGDFQTYIQLSETADVQKTEAEINHFLQPRLDKKTGVVTQYGLQRFGERYLHSDFANGKPVGGRIAYVNLFSGVALFVLIIACINFMNLATARSIKRAKEVGLRKVVGSSRINLVVQFFGEALAFSFLSMILSLILLYFLLPAFNQFTGKQILYPVSQASFWISLLALAFITGIFAGTYPAFYLSSLKPISTLKGVVRFTQGSILFRKGLTIFQFALSILLIISTLVITRQTSFLQNSQLGYDRQNLIYIRIEGELTKQNNYLLFKERASKMPGIAMVDRSSEAPHAMDFVVADDINWEGKEKNASVGFKPTSVGYDFVKLMNLKIAEGRDFSRSNATDSTDAFLINEEAVKEMGMKNPIGKWVSAWQKKGHIIGVLKDFHTHSLREPIKPIIVDIKENEYFGVIIVRTEAGKTREAIASLGKVYKDLNPSYAFAFQFVDEEYKKLYNNELIISKLSIAFATLAILISCLGLFGLSLFSAEQRIKEIGVRKVLGASMSQIISLFSEDFLKLILIAFLIAAPLSWLSMHQWLQGFAYRIDISWWVFPLAASFSVLISLLTISYQAVKTANANPVSSLRSE